MSKDRILFVPVRKDANGNKIGSKVYSHGSLRCKRKPNSPYCQPMHPMRH
jgi:hypothetical protein